MHAIGLAQQKIADRLKKAGMSVDQSTVSDWLRDFSQSGKTHDPPNVATESQLAEIESELLAAHRKDLEVGGLVLRDVEIGEADQLALGRRSGIWTAAIPDILPWRGDLSSLLPGPDLLPDPALSQGDDAGGSSLSVPACAGASR